MSGIGWWRRCALVIVVLGLLGCVGSAPARGEVDDEVVRVVVGLEDPPLAKYRDTRPDVQGVTEARTADGHLDVKDPASREYLSHVASEQGDFEAQLAQSAPAAEIHWRYKVAFNGLAIEVARSQLETIRQLPGVVSLTETYDMEPELDESRSLIGLPQLWQSLPPNGLGAGAGNARRAHRRGRQCHASVLQPGRVQRAGRLPEGAARGRWGAHEPAARDLREQQGDRGQRLRVSR